MKKQTWILVTLIFAMGGGGAFLLSLTGAYLPSGLCLTGAAVALFFVFYMPERNLLDMRALFSLFWLGGAGLSCLKLSHLATDWRPETWVCIGLAYIGFLLGFDCLERRLEKGESSDGGTSTEKKPGLIRGFLEGMPSDPEVLRKRLTVCLVAVTGVSLAAFLLEASVLGFLPIFSDKPHAYSEFHISGVHYFTVSCVLVPALSVLYYFNERKCRASEDRGRFAGLCPKQWMFLGFCDLIALAIPIFCVSRFQLMFALLLAVVVWMRVSGLMKLKYVLLLLAVLVPLYVGLTVARNHDVEYLNGIFEMKQEDMPIFVTQPYMYVANNYDNLNCLIENLPEHSYGFRMAFPLIVFTGMKFRHPEWVNFPIYVNKTELTTVTLIYDAYYDFGIFGVLVFALLLGLFCGWVARVTKRMPNPVGALLYGQATIYLMLSFFTTWYSNPTTWFWYGVSFLCFLAVGWPKRESVDTKLGIE